MNFSQNSSLGSAPSALGTWLKNYVIDLKLELLAINMNITNDSRHFRSSLAQSITSGSIPICLSKNPTH